MHRTPTSSLCLRALRFAVFLLILPLALHAGGSPLAQDQLSASSPQFDSAAEAQFVSLINQERAKDGLPPLTVDRRLTQAARKHSDLMAQHFTISHQFPGEPQVQTRVSNEGLPYDSVSENVGLSNRGVLDAHEGFMHSPPHRAAILDPGYTFVGVGVSRSGGVIYVTEDFAHKLPEYSEPQAEAAVQTAITKYPKLHGGIAPGRRTELQLRRMACNLPLNDKLESQNALQLPGVHGVLVWTADDPANLPKGISQVLLPQVSGYALGACFAPSVSHPGGVYWIVMVTY
jgi:hypothetical protein